MTWPSPVYRRVQRIPDHLNHLGEQLHELAIEVRSSVAGLTGDAIGRAVRDVLIRFWQQSSVIQTVPRHAMERGPYDWSDDPNGECWETGRQRWDEPGVAMPAPKIITSFPMTGNAALALQAAGWMLQTKGSWMGAIGLGLTIGGLAFVGGRSLIAGIGLVDAAVDLTALVGLLASGAKWLRTG